MGRSGKQNKLASALLGSRGFSLGGVDLGAGLNNIKTKTNLKEVLKRLNLIQTQALKDQRKPSEAEVLTLIDFDLSRQRLHGLNLDGSYFENGSFKETSFFIYPAAVNPSNVSLYATSFKGAVFKNIDLNDTILRGCSFKEAVLDSVSLQRANLDYADFQDARITDPIFDRSNMSFTNFENVIFEEKVSFKHSKLQSVDFYNTSLARADFSEVEIIDSKIYDGLLRRTNFSNSKIDGLQIANKSFGVMINAQQVDFSDASINGLAFTGDADLNKASFEHVVVDMSKMEGCYFYKANFKDAYFNKTVFNNSKFIEADFDNAVFENCSFLNVDLKKDRPSNLASAQFINCIFDL